MVQIYVASPSFKNDHTLVEQPRASNEHTRAVSLTPYLEQVHVLPRVKLHNEGFPRMDSEGKKMGKVGLHAPMT